MRQILGIEFQSEYTICGLVKFSTNFQRNQLSAMCEVFKEFELLINNTIEKVCIKVQLDFWQDSSERSPANIILDGI